MAVATAIDLTARFAWEFRLDRVLRTEAVLFLAAGGVFVMLLRRRPRATGWLRLLQVTLAAAFGLAGVRAALWAAGAPVVTANMAIFALAVVAAAIAWVRRRRRVATDS
jgi:hypothetical protein